MQGLTEAPAVGGVTTLGFTKVDSYDTFSAEYAVEDNDIVFHFFLPPEFREHASKRHINAYWTETFPTKLEPVVYSTFKVEPPRVQAAYVNDMGVNSWWLRAYGFGATLDPAALCDLLFSSLDKALDTKNAT